MATQLQFSRRVYGDTSPLTAGRSDSSSPVWKEPPLHVAFAVQDAVPSPQLYHHQRRHYEPEEYGNEHYKTRIPAQHHADSVHDRVHDRQSVSHLDGALQSVAVAHTQPVRRIKAPTTAKKAVATKKPKPQPKRNVSSRKPGWDTDVRAPAAVFDSTLKKSVLFQPRAGDRQREVHEEEQLLSSKQPVQTKPRAKPSSTSAWNARIASSLPTTQLPKRKPKDYVKMNMEKITGQRYETLVQRAQAPVQTRPRGSVFERLAAPTLHKSVTRFRTPSPTRRPMQSTALAEARPFSPVKLTIASPVMATTRAYADESLPRGRGSPRSVRASPNQERGSSPRFGTRVSSPGSRASSPGFRSDRGHHEREQPSMAAQVFDVLDRQQRGRIGVNQILDGLRLLHLPATHNQVSDYVYLIHEGTISTIDLEEWIILVGTLDAASQPATGSAASQPPSTRSRTSPEQTRGASPPSSRGSRRDSPPRSVNQRVSPPRPSPKLMLSSPDGHSELYGDPWSERGAIASSEPQEDPEDWYMQAIQRRVDEMYQRAEEVVAQRQATGDSNQMLERAASAVYQLKSSLYPLVEQAEAMLKDVQQHQTSKLSVRLDAKDLSRIAHHSEDLADLIFEDILLDTVQELNKEERHLSQHRLRAQHADTLDEILLQIQQLEMAEDEMINNQFSLAYARDDTQHTAPTCSITRGKPTRQIATKPMPSPKHEKVDQLSLPLSVVMDLAVDDTSLENPVAKDAPEPTTFDPASAHRRIIDDFEEDSIQERASTIPQPSMAVLGGELFQRIEKNRARFLKHRQLVESSLEATGMDQASVIEMLADLLLDDIATECALELEGGVDALTDTLAETLV